MAIGYACLSVGTNKIDTYKTITINSYSDDKMYEIIKHNLKVLMDTLKYNVKNDIFLFRISSDIIPLSTHKINTFNWIESFKSELYEIGNYIKDNNLRVSMHPGQYTVINSNRIEVVEKSILDLEYHCAFLDSLNLDKTHKVILHIGGIYNDKKGAIDRFKDVYKTLNQNIKDRLVIENDDKSYNIKDVYEIGCDLKIPVVFDNLHHEINNDNTYPELEWINKVMSTWKKIDGKVKIHYSNQDPNKQVGSHSRFIYIDKFMLFYQQVKDLNIDIMLEVKDKNLSALKCIHCTSNTNISTLEQVWAKYKYNVLEKDQKIYLKIRTYLKDRDHAKAIELYKMIEEALATPCNNAGYRNGFDHVWGYFKKVCTPNEKEMFKKKMKLFNEGELKAQNMKKFLYRMTLKYNSEYLIKSYYFNK